MINNLQDLSAIRVRQCRRIQRRQQRVVTINQNHVTLPERRALGERELFFIFFLTDSKFLIKSRYRGTVRKKAASTCAHSKAFSSVIVECLF
jgi:hypothetical protein